MSESIEADEMELEKLREGGLRSGSFQGLLWTQWLTSINDNVFRWFVVGVGKAQLLPEYSTAILVYGAILFTLPYIMFCLLYTSPSPRDQRGSRMPSSA